MKTIGIKLADGSFYPIFKEGEPQKAKLDLTTANDDQTIAMVDLYRSETGAFDDAEYVETLQIDNLIKHPNGETTISFELELEENGDLSASMNDAESGAKSNAIFSLRPRGMGLAAKAAALLAARASVVNEASASEGTSAGADTSASEDALAGAGASVDTEASESAGDAASEDASANEDAFASADDLAGEDDLASADALANADFSASADDLAGEDDLPNGEEIAPSDEATEAALNMDFGGLDEPDEIADTATDEPLDLGELGGGIPEFNDELPDFSDDAGIVSDTSDTASEPTASDELADINDFDLDNIEDISIPSEESADEAMASEDDLPDEPSDLTSEDVSANEDAFASADFSASADDLAGEDDLASGEEIAPSDEATEAALNMDFGGLDEPSETENKANEEPLDLGELGGGIPEFNDELPDFSDDTGIVSDTADEAMASEDASASADDLASGEEIAPSDEATEAALNMDFGGLDEPDEIADTATDEPLDLGELGGGIPEFNDELPDFSDDTGIVSDTSDTASEATASDELADINDFDLNNIEDISIPSEESADEAMASEDDSANADDLANGEEIAPSDEATEAALNMDFGGLDEPDEIADTATDEPLDLGELGGGIPEFNDELPDFSDDAGIVSDEPSEPTASDELADISDFDLDNIEDISIPSEESTDEVMVSEDASASADDLASGEEIAPSDEATEAALNMDFGGLDEPDEIADTATDEPLDLGELGGGIPEFNDELPDFSDDAGIVSDTSDTADEATASDELADISDFDLDGIEDISIPSEESTDEAMASEDDLPDEASEPSDEATEAALNMDFGGLDEPDEIVDTATDEPLDLGELGGGIPEFNDELPDFSDDTGIVSETSEATASDELADISDFDLDNIEDISMPNEASDAVSEPTASDELADISDFDLDNIEDISIPSEESVGEAMASEDDSASADDLPIEEIAPSDEATEAALNMDFGGLDEPDEIVDTATDEPLDLGELGGGIPEFNDELSDFSDDTGIASDAASETTASDELADISDFDLDNIEDISIPSEESVGEAATSEDTSENADDLPIEEIAPSDDATEAALNMDFGGLDDSEMTLSEVTEEPLDLGDFANDLPDFSDDLPSFSDDAGIANVATDDVPVGEKLSSSDDKLANVDDFDISNFDADLPDFSDDLPKFSDGEKNENDLPNFDDEFPTFDNDKGFANDLPDFSDDLPSFGDDDSFKTDNDFETTDFSSLGFAASDGGKSSDDFDFSFDFDEPNEQNDLFSSDNNFSSGLNFDGLYDQETMEGISSMTDYQTTSTIKKKTRVPVIICTICAIICVLATILVLFIVPSKYNLIPSRNTRNVTSITQSQGNYYDGYNSQSNIDIYQQRQNESPIYIERVPSSSQTWGQDNRVIPQQPIAPLPRPSDIVYRVKWGDTLWDIANAYYRNPWRYKMIAQYNGIRNPDYILSGQTIRLPAE